jgi:hypothetical protein
MIETTRNEFMRLVDRSANPEGQPYSSRENLSRSAAKHQLFRRRDFLGGVFSEARALKHGENSR